MAPRRGTAARGGRSSVTRHVLVGAMLTLGLITAAPGAHAQESRPSFAQPDPSPDGSEIAFVSAGDIWTVPATGGDAHLLVSNAADETTPLYSPDGTRLAFLSNRQGDYDIYVLTLGTGEVRRVTYGDGNEELDAWSPDGRWIYFADGREDPGGQPAIWRISSAGGTPMPVLADKFAPEFDAAVSPDGKTVAIAAMGEMADGQWWRKGHAHIDEAEIWLATQGEPPQYHRLSATGSKNIWPMWSADGKDVLYMSDRSGAENLWSQPAAGGDAHALTDFKDGRFLFPRISTDGRTVAFERDFSVWTLRLPDGRPTKLAITLRGAPETPAVEHLDMSNGFRDLALSPDGKKVAFTAHGEVFATAAKDGGPAVRVTHTVAPETDLAWAPDSRRLAYVSLRSGTPKLWMYDFVSHEETELTSGPGQDVTPRFSPDGKKLAYVHAGTEVHVKDLASGKDQRLATGLLWTWPFLRSAPLVWSPDGKWLAYFNDDKRGFGNVWVVPAAGGEARPVSGLADASGSTIAWSSDGKTIYFDTQQRTEPGRVARVDLVPVTPVFREDRFQDLFNERKAPSRPDTAQAGRGGRGRSGGAAAGGGSARRGAAAKDTANAPETKIVFDEIRRRLSLLPVGVNVRSIVLSPDGKTLVLSASAEGQQNLYAFTVDPAHAGPVVTRQITSTPGNKSTPQFTPDGKELFFLDRGRIQSVELTGGRARSVATTARMDVGFDAEKVEVFDEGWSLMRDNYYDDHFHGADWNAVKRMFAPQIEGARTRPGLSRLMNEMLGELNGSHLGYRIRGEQGPTSGSLGLHFDRATYETQGKLRVTEVVPLGPAAVAGGIAAGDYVLAVDGTPMDAHTNLDQVLQGKTGDKVTLRVSTDAGGSNAWDVSVKPISLGAQRELELRDWVEGNRAYVDRISGGKIGYVYMRDMSQGALDQLMVDLDAANFEKQGVVIDIRGNNGGFVNAYALDMFSRKGYITMQMRGYPEMPARSVLGQRSLEEKTVLVVNRNTLSDGEDFTEGYRTLGLGKVVGEPTAGWIVYTWGGQLVNGATFRLPRVKVRAHDGQVMELHPRPVDVEVIRPMGESYTGTDSQLAAAVKVLMGG
jgi:tricorn protease